MTENAYIHIPFCVKKCKYCAFISYNKLQLKTAYIQALTEEIKVNYKGEKLKTLYFGGGTPSLLNISELSQLLSCFHTDNYTEITIEANPNKLKFEYLKELKTIGINRLSIGVQSFNDNILQLIGRLHSVNDINNTIENSRKAGFENISIDLIYGLPTQTIDDFKESLQKAVKLGVDHISLYGLKIEEGTEFQLNKPPNLPDDDTQADMYLLASDILLSAGYQKYEVSNFALKDKESKHNLNYWNANTYYGFGCAAHGYENDIRYENETDIEKYILNPTKKIVQSTLTTQDKLEEQIFLGFRKAEGINIENLKKEFKYDFEAENESKLADFIESKHIIKTQQGYAFTDEGFLLSNVILSEFLK